MGGEEVAYLVGAVAGNDDEFGDASQVHGVDGALEEGALPYPEQALGFVVGERAQALGHSRSKNYSSHISS